MGNHRSAASRREHASKLLDEGGEEIGGSGVDDLGVDRPVAVDDPVANPSRLGSRDLWEPILDLGVELGGGFTENGEVP